MKTVIIGASDNPDRYSYKALKLLQKMGHDLFPVHIRLKEIDGLPVYNDISHIREDIDTVTLYINQCHSSEIMDDIIALSPRRIIFNPGAENPELAECARKAGIETINGCTLVMLKTGRF